MRFSTACTLVFLFVAACEMPIPAKYADADGDGYDESVDCNDSDASINPGVHELCDGIDNDCDGTADNRELQWCLDYDDDGFGDPSSCGYGICDSAEHPDTYVADNTDCDDRDPDVHPNATELCDGIDNDCDGSTDPDTSEDALTQYYDADLDGFGDTETFVESCTIFAGYVSIDGDCDNESALIHPDAEEADGVEGIEGLDSCDDDVDNNCDGLVDSRAPECAGSEAAGEDTSDTASP